MKEENGEKLGRRCDGVSGHVQALCVILDMMFGVILAYHIWAIELKTFYCQWLLDIQALTASTSPTRLFISPSFRKKSKWNLVVLTKEKIRLTLCKNYFANKAMVNFIALVIFFYVRQSVKMYGKIKKISSSKTIQDIRVRPGRAALSLISILWSKLYLKKSINIWSAISHIGSPSSW